MRQESGTSAKTPSAVSIKVREADPAGYMIMGKPGEAAKISMQQHGDLQSGCTDWVPLLRERPRDRPFFLWLAALDPHRDYEEKISPLPTPLEQVIVPRHLPDTPAVRRELAMYYDEIERLDRFVGDMLAELDAQKVAGNTMVVFMSDNGRPFPRDKTALFEGGIKTPLIVRWPRSSCTQTPSVTDLSAPSISLPAF